MGAIRTTNLSIFAVGDDVRDTGLHQHALAALQKLSLRQMAQKALVTLGMVPWIIEYLEHHQTLSDHSVEYSMAMLMNMCLCPGGREACERLDVLSILDGLIQVIAHSSCS
jgi:LisH domain-containing protein ARMC9